MTLLLALVATAFAADFTPAYGSMFIGVEPHFDTVRGWNEPLIGASAERYRYTYWQIPFAEMFLVAPGAFYGELNVGGLLGLLAQRRVDPGLAGTRAAEFYDTDLFRFYLGPTLGSDEVGIGAALGYSASAVGLTHTEVMTSGMRNVIAGGLGGKLVSYVVLDSTLGFHTHVGLEALMTKDGGTFDGTSFTVDEYVMLAVGENFGFFLHPGFRLRSTSIGYEKDQKQRMSTFLLGAGILLP